MLEEPQLMAKKPIPATPHLLPAYQPKFTTTAGACNFSGIRTINSRPVRDRCKCRVFIQQTRTDDQELLSSWSSFDRYFCSCGHHASHHPPRKINSANITPPAEPDMEMEDQALTPKEEEEEIRVHCIRPLTPVPQQEAEANKHIWHLYQKTAELQHELSLKPTPDEVKTSIGDMVGSLEDRILELEDRLEETELRLEDSERKARSLQEEVEDLLDENEDLRHGLPPVSRAGSDEVERNLQEALSALRPVSKENPWRVRVNMVLDADQNTPVPQETDEYARLDGLGCFQVIDVEGPGCRNFQVAVSSTFASGLLTKGWMPLIASKTESGHILLQRATDVEGFPSLWNVDFLRKTCAVTVNGRDELYIAPHAGSLALENLESPRVSPGLTEASTISSNSVLRRSNRKRSITNNNKIETAVVMKRVRVKS